MYFKEKSMKKLILVLSLFATFAFAQTTETAAPVAPVADAPKTEAPTAPAADVDAAAKHQHGDHHKAGKKNLRNEAKEACLVENKELKGKELKKCVKGKMKSKK